MREILIIHQKVLSPTIQLKSNQDSQTQTITLEKYKKGRVEELAFNILKITSEILSFLIVSFDSTNHPPPHCFLNKKY